MQNSDWQENSVCLGDTYELGGMGVNNDLSRLETLLAKSLSGKSLGLCDDTCLLDPRLRGDDNSSLGHYFTGHSRESGNPEKAFPNSRMGLPRR